jgi:hypothetical protein
LARWWATARSGSGATSSSSGQRRAGDRGGEHRAPERPAQAPRRSRHEPAQDAELDGERAQEDRPLRAAEVARPVELPVAEVRSGVHGRGRDHPVTRPQEQGRGLRDDQRGQDGQGDAHAPQHGRGL